MKKFTAVSLTIGLITGVSAGYVARIIDADQWCRAHYFDEAYFNRGTNGLPIGIACSISGGVAYNKFSGQIEPVIMTVSRRIVPEFELEAQGLREARKHGEVLLLDYEGQSAQR